jgi:DEAD/DEAH box helicase domain-containing protein
VVLLDAASAVDAEALHRAWRRWLQLFNTVQFMPGTCLVTADGLSAHDYDGLPSVSASVPPAQPAAQAALNAAWQAVVEQALDGLVDGLKQLALAGAAPPEVGLELADARGRVLADSELAWAPDKLAVLRPDQADLVELWNGEGWKVLLMDDALSVAAGIPWAVAVATGLGLELNVNEGGAT